MCHRIRFTFPCFIVALLAVETSTSNAQYLAERLLPPQQVSIPALPMTGQPVEPRVFGAEKERPHLWALPFGAFPGASIVLITEKRLADWKRPVLDVPSLASESDPTKPTTPSQPVAPRAYVSAPSPLQSPALARFPIPNEPVVRADEDPSTISAFLLLTGPVPLATPNSAPLLRLAAPDPFEHIRIIRLANAPPDSNDPASAQDRPPLPRLPMVELP